MIDPQAFALFSFVFVFEFGGHAPRQVTVSTSETKVGLVTLVCWIAQVCVVTKRVALFRTPYSPVIDHAARIHAKRTVLVLTISDEDTENI